MNALHTDLDDIVELVEQFSAHAVPVMCIQRKGFSHLPMSSYFILVVDRWT